MADPVPAPPSTGRRSRAALSRSLRRRRSATWWSARRADTTTPWVGKWSAWEDADERGAAACELAWLRPRVSRQAAVIAQADARHDRTMQELRDWRDIRYRDLVAERNGLAAVIAQVRELHVCVLTEVHYWERTGDDYQQQCAHCTVSWPCPTVAALDGSTSWSGS